MTLGRRFLGPKLLPLFAGAALVLAAPACGSDSSEKSGTGGGTSGTGGSTGGIGGTGGTAGATGGAAGADAASTTCTNGAQGCTAAFGADAKTAFEQVASGCVCGAGASACGTECADYCTSKTLSEKCASCMIGSGVGCLDAQCTTPGCKQVRACLETCD